MTYVLRNREAMVEHVERVERTAQIGGEARGGGKDGRRQIRLVR